ncbi:MAG: respiratory nitrate reductase subunit gamma [Cellulomonas sp.]
MSALDAVLWVALPYAAIAVFVVGHIWRYRYDQFGWTTRSSQLYENKLLRAGSPMFHVGIIMVAGGHAVGLLVPAEWLDAIGIHEHVYHLGATVLGSFAAVLTVAGLVILIYRRRTVAPVFIATTRMDKLMYVALAAALGFGSLAVIQHQILGAGYDYRGSVSPWIRSILSLRPDAALMAGVPLAFQVHVVASTLLFALWPFTRLVHVFSAPLGYLTRPYVVYRSRDEGLGTRSTRRGWERVERPGTRAR